MSNDFEGFLKASGKTIRGVAMSSAAGAGATAGVSVGNSLIAAGLGAACSPFALVIPLAAGGAFLAYKVCRKLGVED